MKPTAIQFVLAAIAIVLIATFTSAQNTPQQPTPIFNGIAVVELFTSEGCSSCPPADKLLAEVIELADRENAQIFGLSFHVGYWNRLGWTDPFSSTENTQRQYWYSSSFNRASVYTPQAIVNGQWEFVGSDSKLMAESLRAALQTKPTGTLTIESLKLESDQKNKNHESDKNGEDKSRTIQVTLNHKDLGDRYDDIVINIAAAERNLKVDVPRGENRGRQLSHQNVVRAFQTITPDPAKPQPTVTLTLPDDLKTENTSIIIYAQNKESRHIINAAAAKIPAE